MIARLPKGSCRRAPRTGSPGHQRVLVTVRFRGSGSGSQLLRGTEERPDARGCRERLRPGLSGPQQTGLIVRVNP
jgi:hypothetical protein